MAAIPQTSAFADKIPTTVANITLSASDTMTYERGSGQIMVLYNPTAGTISPKFTGSTSTTISPDGYGGTVSVAAGKTVAVPAGATVVVHLDDIYTYLSGNVTVTLGTGVIAQLFV